MTDPMALNPPWLGLLADQLARVRAGEGGGAEVGEAFRILLGIADQAASVDYVEEAWVDEEVQRALAVLRRGRPSRTGGRLTGWESWPTGPAGGRGARVDLSIELEERDDVLLLFEALKAFGLKVETPPGWVP
jgi:hypothetical protein